MHLNKQFVALISQSDANKLWKQKGFCRGHQSNFKCWKLRLFDCYYLLVSFHSKIYMMTGVLCKINVGIENLVLRLWGVK